MLVLKETPSEFVLFIINIRDTNEGDIHGFCHRFLQAEYVSFADFAFHFVKKTLTFILFLSLSKSLYPFTIKLSYF